MKTPDINNTPPKRILVKEPFRRLIPSDTLAPGLNGFPTMGYDAEYRETTMTYEILSQADFLREYDVNSHKINSLKYYPNPYEKDETGRVYAKIRSRVAVPLQSIFHLKRTVALTGKGTRKRILTPNPGKREQELLAEFNRGWSIKQMEKAIRDGISADGKTGDCAVCFYLDNGKLGWRSFSYEKGDTLYPHYDPVTGKLALFGRKYAMKNENDEEIAEYLDVWDSKYYVRYRYDKKGLKAAAAKSKELLGLSGWVLDDYGTHGFKRVPIAYDRYGEPFWAKSEDLIDKIELSLSNLMENNNAFALRILLAFGQDMKVTSDLDGTPNLIESPDTNAKASFLEPADSSGSMDTQLKWLKDMAYRGSFVVETPEIKSGADMSSLTVKMLFADSYLKGQDDADHFRPWLADIVELFKYGYAIEIGRAADFEDFFVEAEIEPFIFMSESEDINALVQLHAIGAVSSQTASEVASDMGYAVQGERGRVMQEEHDALVAESVQKTEDTKVNTVNNARNQ